jgi:MFS family permease
MAGSVSDKLSRKRTISLGAFIFAIGSAISAGSPNLACLLVGRCVAGTGEGLFLGCTGVYLCEISPKREL